MTYTIQSARFANAEMTSVVLQTEEAGAVAISAADRPELWDQYQQWVGNGGVTEADVSL